MGMQLALKRRRLLARHKQRNGEHRMSKRKKRPTEKQRVHNPIGRLPAYRPTEEFFIDDYEQFKRIAEAIGGEVIESPPIPGVNSVADLLFGPEKK